MNVPCTVRLKGGVATTGHSTNFSMDLLIPLDRPQDPWCQRGVAFLLSLAGEAIEILPGVGAIVFSTAGEVRQLDSDVACDVAEQHADLVLAGCNWRMLQDCYCIIPCYLGDIIRVLHLQNSC